MALEVWRVWEVEGTECMTMTWETRRSLEQLVREVDVGSAAAAISNGSALTRGRARARETCGREEEAKANKRERGGKAKAKE